MGICSMAEAGHEQAKRLRITVAKPALASENWQFWENRCSFSAKISRTMPRKTALLLQGHGSTTTATTILVHQIADLCPRGFDPLRLKAYEQ